LNPHTLSGTGT